jgi:hypothetical protein
MTKSAPDFDRITQHPFVVRVLKDATPVMRAESQRKAGLNEEAYELTVKDIYLSRVAFTLGQVLSQIDRIEQAGLLMKTYPKMMAWRKRFGRFHWYQYHMENYYISAAGVLDRMLPLINETLLLRIPDEEVRFRRVSRVLRKSDHEELANLLTATQKATEAIKDTKDLVTHASRYHEDDLWHIGLLEFVLSHGVIEDEDGYLAADLRFFTSMFNDEKRKLMSDNNMTAIDDALKYFDQLEPPYTETIKRLT